MNKFEYKNLTPFKWFVLENFPFIEADFDALTEWQLFCKLGKEMNKIINSENTLGIQIENFTNAFIELQNYVNNYFDNLDVQEEVNNKLNQMTEDGTLDRIINENIFEDIKNRMSALETNVNANIDELNEENDDIKEYIFKTPYTPESRNIKQTTPKYINYSPLNKELTVIQKNHSGYLKYVFNTKNGDTSNASVGLSWDLIRLKKVLFCPHAYVFKNNYESVVGKLTTLSAPVVINGLFENEMFVNNNFPLSANGVFYKNKESIAVYGLTASDGSPAEVNYKIKFPERKGKANILFYCSAGSARNVDIILDGKVIANLDLSVFAKNSVNCFYKYEFDVPIGIHNNTNKIIDVTIKNNDTLRTMYFSCMNYMELKDYDGRDYDSIKVTSSEIYYINHDGASDYAIFDSDLQKFMGSYHGGEIALQQQFTIPTNEDSFDNANFILANLPDTEKSFITTYFELLQVTNLNNKGTMISIFDFNNDGQIEMNFNFKGDINTTSFFTALTCNSKKLDVVKFPDNIVLPEGETELIPNNGLVAFAGNNAPRIRMDIIYSKFYDEHIKQKNGYVLSNQYYNKHYYGAVMNSDTPVNIKNLCFKKLLDFYTY